MTPEEFITRWKGHEFNEREGAQLHFSHLCRLLGVEEPLKKGEYQFERGAEKSSGGNGWADVWKRGHFAWENKKPGRNLKDALKQLTDYALQLESPPLLVVCDRERIIIHTAFTGYPDEPKEIRIEELVDESKRQLLRWVFTEPNKLRPEKSSAAITAEAAKRFADLAEAMRQRGQDPDKVAHFLVQCLFCMFAEDEELLPEGIFTSLLTKAGADADRAADRITKLFTAMGEQGGDYGDDAIAWFNGGLFKAIAPPKLIESDLATLRAAAANMDWRAIDPTIFGTLFERGLGDRRAPLGAHYTDTGTIAKLVAPLVSEPLLAEWEAVHAKIAKLAPKFGMTKGRGKSYRSNDAKLQGEALYQSFLLRLSQFRVLDPACGSGNFLYLALKALRDVEKLAHVQAQELGLHGEVTMQTGPHNILGLEINEFAAELARVTVWIGDIQWCRQNVWQHSINPILKPLDGIQNRDALLNKDGTESQWPKADVIVGNPPFLGTKKQWSELGREYTERMRSVYGTRVPGFADLVCYWFEKARAQIEAGNAQMAGLVATNSIRGGENRSVLDRIVQTTRIFRAWSDESWVNDGAAVRVSMVCFGKNGEPAQLDENTVVKINPDLTSGVAVTTAKKLIENANCAFVATVKAGPFDIPGETARAWLKLHNPNGMPNSDVVKPWANGMDVTRRSSDTWIIDFGVRMEEAAAELYETPFAHVKKAVSAQRDASTKDTKYKRFWQMARPIPAMREALRGRGRYLVTPVVAKYRLFAWMDAGVLADHQLIAIAREDDTTFGVLHSRFHEIWALRLGTELEDRPRYTPTTTFETFPFPDGLTPKDTKDGAPDTEAGRAISAAAKQLNNLRNTWLNPPTIVDWVRTPEEEAAGFPKRPVAKPGYEAELKKYTLTNLYNARAKGDAAWLDRAHKDLDKAVAAAYGWTDYTPDMPDEEILGRLLALNQARVDSALLGEDIRPNAKKAKVTRSKATEAKF
ncbi:DNA methyltransferase [Arenimonas sp.]|uniref:class I SAM-dependent DNA methyltransferase n=1 Tax=Arenimonas sp. TaxID=1872635 RepID=UPI0025BDB049|nr:DNA methyltransferase [Arenimonas sp.]